MAALGVMGKVANPLGLQGLSMCGSVRLLVGLVQLYWVGAVSMPS